MITLNYIAVDDEAIHLKELEKSLKSFPFLNKIELFEDPFLAIRYINEKQPDVIFLDFEMPGMSGKEILDKINYEAQVVFITSHFEPIQKIINHPGYAIIQGYLSKPINNEELRTICLKLNVSKKAHTSDKIIINDGIKKQIFIKKEDLSYIKANEKFTDWHFLNKPPLKAIKAGLSDVE